MMMSGKVTMPLEASHPQVHLFTSAQNIIKIFQRECWELSGAQSRHFNG